MGWIILIGIIFVVYLIRKSKSTDNEVFKAPAKSTSNSNSGKYHSTVRFRYKDAEDNETERTVDVITGRKGEQFRAYCRLRKESRNFYFKRIQNFEVVDVNTGEVLTPMEWRFQLQGTKVAKAELKREQKYMQSLAR
tara:strand:- start:639 stop:1049 length:411 start_codon:yes stop_codon:yes gene_type:complete